MTFEDEFLRILNGDEPFAGWDLENQRIRCRRLASPRTSRHHDVLAQLHRQANELRVFAPGFEPEQLLLSRVQLLARVETLGEKTAGGELVQGWLVGARTADRDRDALRQGGRRQNKLHPLSRGQGREQNRCYLIHALLGGA